MEDWPGLHRCEITGGEGSTVWAGGTSACAPHGGGPAPLCLPPSLAPNASLAPRPSQSQVRELLGRCPSLGLMLWKRLFSVSVRPRGTPASHSLSLGQLCWDGQPHLPSQRPPSPAHLGGQEGLGAVSRGWTPGKPAPAAAPGTEEGMRESPSVASAPLSP